MLACMNAQIVEPSERQVALAAETLKLLADPTRVRILWALLHGEHSVGQLADHVGATATCVSQHLAKLRLARLVRARREGTFVYYLADNEHVRRLLQEALFHTSHVLNDAEAAPNEPVSVRAEEGRAT
jgi:DNA-binding transcriptional ArsR family regulator